MHHPEISLNLVDDIHLSKGMVLTLADGNIIACNAKTENILGYSLTQIQRDTTTNFPGRIYRNGSLPTETHPAMVALQTGEPCNHVVMEFYKPNGDQILLLVDSQPLFTPGSAPYGVVTTFSEIPQTKFQQKNQDIDIALSDTKFFHLSLDLLCITGFDGYFKQVNPAFNKLLGYSKAELLTTPFIDFVHPADKAATLAELEKLRRGASTLYFENRYRCQDGSYKWLTWTAVPIRGLPFVYGIGRDVTERKRTEAELAQRNSILTAVIEDASDVIFVKDLHGRYVMVNHNACEWIGITIETMLGKDDTELFPPQIAKDIMETDRQVLKTGESITYTETLTKQETVRTLLSTKYPWLDARGNIIGVIGIARDITERYFLEEALRESELNFRTLANTIPQLVWTAQPDGRIDYVNHRWCEYTGMNLEQIPGEEWSCVIHPDDYQRVLNLWNECLHAGKEYNDVYRLRCANDGQYRWFLSRALPRKNNLGIVKWFGSCTDIDHQKRAQEALQTSLQQAQLAREQAETANRLKDEFLTVLSHELRTPLHPILGWTQILQSETLDSTTTNEALEIIEQNVKLEVDLIDNLLDIARIMQGKMILDASPVDLASVILAALETIHLAAEIKAIEIQTIFTDSIKLTANRVRLQQVVWNLLSNAIKFTPHGGRVEVKLERVGSMAQITVSDTGKGINPEFLPYIFQYFRQEDASISRKFGGLGVGLAIVRNLVEMHGGTIEASSPGEAQGATFQIKLPLS